MHVIILAGGSGTRLWPLSRKGYPKQFLKLGSDRSLLQKTLDRHEGMEASIVTGRASYHDVKAQVGSEIDIILEPEQKNTAPAIALALTHLKEQGCPPETVVCVSSADHMIAPAETYREGLENARTRAEEGKVVIFGVRPTRPETGYGYIKANGNRVESFVEKPDRKKAESFLESGDYYWNAGLFVFTIETFFAELEKHAPEIVQLAEKGEESFSQMPNISIDYALIEKSENLAMVPLDLVWSDVGSWDNVYELLDKDDNQNALSGEVVSLDSEGSLVMSEGPLTAVIGLKEMLVVATEDVVLVAPKSEAQQVKTLVAELKERGRPEVDTHRTVKRPWGAYTVLEEGERYKIKRIEVYPLQKLSLQMHYHRSEHWVIVSGTAQVTIGEEETVVHEGESIFVPKSSIHRVENPGKVPLEIIEVQVGEYLGEDDIVRLEDVYGRLNEGEAFNLLRER